MGRDPFTSFGNGSTKATLRLPANPAQLTVRAVVTCSPGYHLTSLRQFIIDDCIDPCDLSPRSINGEVFNQSIEILALGKEKYQVSSPNSENTTGIDIIEFKVFDLLGRHVLQGQVGQNELIILDRLPPGSTYLLSVQTNQQSAAKLIFR